MSGIWHNDVSGGEICSLPRPVGYSDAIYCMHWLADELVMENLTKLTRCKVFITKWGDREWFYSIPRRLARLEEFTVIGLV